MERLLDEFDMINPFFLIESHSRTRNSNVRLRLVLRPIGDSKDLKRRFTSKPTTGYHVDDKTYFRIINYAYSELAINVSEGM